MNLEIVYDKMGRRCISGRDLYAGFKHQSGYEEWLQGITAFGFEKDKDYTVLVPDSEPVLLKAEIQEVDHLFPMEVADWIIRLKLALAYTEEFLNVHCPGLVYDDNLFAVEKIAERAKELAKEAEEDQTLNRNTINHQGAVVKEKTYADIVSEQREPLTITRIAKDFGLSAIRLNELLDSLKIQYRVYGTWRLESDYLDKGLVVYETHGYHDHEGNHQEAYRMKWTQKGRLFIYEQLKKANILPLCETKEESGSHV